MNDALLDAVPHIVVRAGVVVGLSSSLADELGCDPDPLLGRLDDVGTRLDDVGFDELVSGDAAVRVRLSSDLDDRPVRLRRLGADGDQAWIEVRSLGAEFRAEALLRRSGYGHMLISPESWVHWSLSSDELHEAMPGDDPIKWVELMNPDDMQAIALAVHDVSQDPDLRRTVTHRLAGDDEHLVVDTIESVMYDPDLRAVLMRSRLERTDGSGESDVDASRSTAAPWAGISVSDHLPIGVLAASRAGRVLHRNAVAAELIGVRSGQMLVPDGDGPWALATLAPEASAPFVRMIRDAADGRSGYCMVPSPFDPDRWLRMSVSPATATTLVLTIEDTTELADAERALRASNRLLEALDSHAEDLVMVFGSDGGGRYISSSVRKHLGDAADVTHADDFYPFVHPPDRQVVDDLIRRVQERPSSSEQVEFRVDVGGEVGRWHQATMTNLLDDPDVRGFVVTLRDVHERHLAERELQFRATHDSLTTLPDRAALQSRLEALLAESKAGGKRIALMFCDIDHFKSINDRAGHHVGDLVLTEVAARLRSALRSSDVVGRFGGDEFVVVVPDVEDEAYALAVAERIFDTVTGRGLFEGIEVDVRVSMGVAVTGDDCATAATLLQRADLAMYEAKAQGRGRVSLFVPSGEGGSERDTLRADLHDAIADRQLAVHYQPIVPLRDGLDAGMEAFARWEHPALGMIEAKRFIGIAEGAGLMSDLGLAMVELVAPFVAANDDGSFVCLNLSPSQVSSHGAHEALLAQFELARVSPDRVVVEITEAVFAQESSARANLVALREAGVRVHLDDFGVGYSSLGHLHRFPVDGLKIDATLIHPRVDERLVRLIVGLGEALGIRTVAEGVETDEQLALVTELGVDYAQGYLLGRPAPLPSAAPASEVAS